MKFILSAVAFFFLHYQGNAQTPWQLLENWARQYPVEKVHLHTDRESYIAGETAWFKAYLSSEYLPDTISTTLYVELVNEAAVTIGRKVLPVLLGAASGQLELPDTLVSGMYTVRAYTQTMKTVFPEFVFNKGVFIYGKKEKHPAVSAASAVRLEFFPEGGSLLTGVSNNIAFKAVSENGYPASAKGVIKNSKGAELTSFSDFHDGMGMFELNPVKGETYYAETASGKFMLPEVQVKGIALNIIPHPQGFMYELQQKKEDPSFTAAYLVGQMQHRIVLKQDLKQDTESLQGTVNTEKLHSGILQITFFNKNGMPLAERLWFVNNHEYLQPAELLPDTIDMNKRGRNRFRIAMQDTVQGSISVAIVDAAYETRESRSENILTSFLLTSDLKGYVHNPVFYFSGTDDSVKTAIDLLMMTHGWRRFKWTELSAAQALQTANPSYITLAGKATLRGTNKPFADKTMLLMVNSINNKKKRSTQLLQTGKDGDFLIDSLLFFDKNLLVFSDVRGKKSQFIDVLLKGDSLHRHFVWTGYRPVPGKQIIAPAQWQMDYDALLKENGLMMEGVTIKVQKKSPIEQVDEKYTSGMFSGDATKAIDLVNSDEALPYTNIFEYLQNRVNGLQVTVDGADYGVFYRQGPSISSMGNIPMTIFLDEIETDISVVAAIPANQVALVKLYNTFAGAWGNAPGGVLAIYTRKGEDVKYAGRANVQIYNGYSVVKEFYAPDYKIINTNDKVDNRITLDWRPNIFVNSINPRIPVSFYNNDRTKKFKIIAEGMTTSGKLIWLEKSITGK